MSNNKYEYMLQQLDRTGMMIILWTDKGESLLSQLAWLIDPFKDGNVF